MATSTRRSLLFGHSDELEKLLASAGDASQPCGVLGGGGGGASSSSSPAADAAGFDAEAMVDELLASTWEPMPGESVAVSAPAKQAAFAQQTRAMNALHSVLADAVERLKKHRQAVAQRIAALEGENAGAGAKYQDALRSPEALLHQVCSQMEDMEERFTKVSSSAVLIGDKLAKLDGERARVLETDELMEALVALNEPPAAGSDGGGGAKSNSSSSSSRLVRTLRDPAQLHEAACVVKKMGVFSSELSSPAIARAVAEIERLSQKIETDLLAEFSAAQERAGVAGMRRCAASLIAYNDKEKVADRYVWNVVKDRVGSLQPPPTAAASLDPLQDLAALFETIRAICREQFAVIEQVFPPAASSSVRELLVERLFNDPAFGVFSSLDQILSASAAAATAQQQQADASPSATSPTAAPTSPMTAGYARRTQASEEYVTLLCGAYERTCALTASIEDIAEKSSNASNSNVAKKEAARQPEEDEDDGSDNNNSSSNGGNCDVEGERERMRTFLSLQLHSLFGSHRPKYVRSELELLQLTCRDIVAGVRFPQQLTARQKAAAIKAGKNAAASSSSSAASTTSPASTLASASSAQLVLPLPSSSSLSAASSTSLDTAAGGGAVPLSEWSQLFFESLRSIADDADAPDRYLRALRSAIDRCRVVLENESELRGELLTKLFSVFAAGYGDEYLAKLASLANDMLQDPFASPDATRQFFQVIELLLKRVDLLDDAFDSVLAPAQADAPTQLTICYESKRKQLDRLEQLVARGLRQVFAVVDKDVSALLAVHQDKADFVGSEANMSLASSRACRRCADYLQPLLSAACAVLMDENRERFLAALAAQFKDAYLQHLLRFRFDPDGACMLLRDVAAFRQVFCRVAGARALPAVDDAFDVLHEVANAFALPPENLGGFLRDGKLAALGRPALLELVKRRVDYKANADKISLS